MARPSLVSSSVSLLLLILHCKVPSHVDKFRIIAAMSRNGVIGIDGSIPWHLPDDRRLFQQLTHQSILIIGRRTFQEEPKLDHINHALYCIVVSQSMTDIDSYREHCPNTALGLATSFSDALTLATTIRQQRKLQDHWTESSDLGCWIAGGEGLFREALLHESVFQLHLSIVNVDINVQGRSRDEFAMFPSQDLWGDRFEKVADTPYSQNGHAPSFSYHVYQKKGQV